MKPRLPSLPLTSEDYNIVMYGSHPSVTHEYAQLAIRLDRISETEDRRDAELMYQWQRWRALDVRESMCVPNVWWLKYKDDELPWQPVGGQL